MVTILYKWLIVFALSAAVNKNHPVYLSVTTIEHNRANTSVEISCKIFTDDFEISLRKLYDTKVDLLNTKYRSSMNVLVNDYIQKHLTIKVNDQAGKLQFLGYEQQDEGIVAYYEMEDIALVKKLEVKNDLLYEYKEQQMGIIHATVNDQRKSTRLNNPESVAVFLFP